MARLVCAVLLLAVAFASADDERIVGGFPTAIENNPSFLTIERSATGVWTQFCGGILLTSSYILSTASCFVGPPLIVRLRRVRAGTSERNVGGQVSGISQLLKHPAWYEGLNRDSDISLSRLEIPFQYSLQVQQAVIPAQGIFIPDNMPGRNLGFGVTMDEEFPTIKSRFLKEIGVYTVNNGRCAMTYASALPIPLTITPNMICASAIGEGGACVGDRGGPLYINNLAVGLVSWGVSCTNATFPTVHTLISSYTDWIIANVW